MENLTAADYMHTQKVCNNFEIKYLGKYHGLYVQSGTLLLVDVYQNFRSMCLKIYQIDLAHLLLHQVKHNKQLLKRPK